MIATLLVILAIGAAFRFAELRELPRDMIFDHPEKLLDVNDVLSGTPSIFFERNTGREPWQFYWTVALIKLFNLYIDYFTLKLGTSLIGWLMLPAVFLLAHEIFGTRTALLATLFAAVASWGVLGARYGLRYPLAPCATAWTMYFLVRGLRRDERNAMIAAGVWLGIGLQGYTAYRFMLPVFVLLVLFWATWQYARRQRPAAARALVNGGLALVLALLVMMPLVRYGTEHADRLFYRANTRLTSLARPIQGSVPLIFLSNVGNVLLMFNYTSDDTWVVNIRFKPAVDIVLAGLIVIGATGALVASVRSRDPWPAVILGAGILMLMPSALSIAFPKENPSLVRTSGAIPMIMTICAVAPGMLIEQARQRQTWLRAATIALVGLMAVAIVAINYQRAFVEYRVKYCQNVQNSADISGEMQAFIDAGNPRENVWLVGYDNWVDYRAVGIGIGDFHFQNRVVGPSAATAVDLHGRPALFALNRADNATLVALAKKYPMGSARVVPIADCPEKNFVLMTIPSSITHN